MLNIHVGRNVEERPPAVAGRFYPADPKVLREQVEGFLAHGESVRANAGVKGVIAPHAGYIYSGPIAGSAYAAFRGCRDQVKRIVLIGPAHFEPFEGLALSSFGSFATPLGPVTVDKDAVATLIHHKLAFILEDAHQREHSLEVQLPFLQVLLKDFKIVPILAGSVSSKVVASVIEALWGGPETRFVISSDLSHYLDSDTARKMDGHTATCIERLRPDGIDVHAACGRLPILGMMAAARSHGLGVETVDLRNSGDTAGPRDQVVGYGAFAFCESK